jgi:hypothetical protein
LLTSNGSVSFKSAGPLGLSQLIDSTCHSSNGTVRCLVVDEDLQLKFVGRNESSPAVYVLTVPVSQANSSPDENGQSHVEGGNGSLILIFAVVLGSILFCCIFVCVEWSRKSVDREREDPFNVPYAP